MPKKLQLAYARSVLSQKWGLWRRADWMGGGFFNSNRDHFLHSADLLLVITLRLNLHKDDVVLLGSGHQDCRLDEQPWNMNDVSYCLRCFGWFCNWLARTGCHWHHVRLALDNNAIAQLENNAIAQLLLLTCELAWYHPLNPPPPLQGPVESNSLSVSLLRELLCQRRWLPQLLYEACDEQIKLREVFYLRGPSVLLVGCSQLTAPQELLRGDGRHLSISAKSGKGHNVN